MAWHAGQALYPLLVDATSDHMAFQHAGQALYPLVVDATLDHMAFRHAGQALYPLVVDATSDHMTVRGQGWRTTTGVVLERPIRVTLDFHPSLARSDAFND
jgi:hypothetical protein